MRTLVVHMVGPARRIFSSGYGKRDGIAARDSKQIGNKFQY
jgi:hypothetical protein